jgi:hypothetical protein
MCCKFAFQSLINTAYRSCSDRISRNIVTEDFGDEVKSVDGDIKIVTETSTRDTRGEESIVQELRELLHLLASMLRFISSCSNIDTRLFCRGCRCRTSG